MRISDWSSDVCSSDLDWLAAERRAGDAPFERLVMGAGWRQIFARLGTDRIQAENAYRNAAQGLDAADDVAVRVDDGIEAEAEERPRELPVGARGGRSEERRVGKEGVSTRR